MFNKIKEITEKYKFHPFIIFFIIALPAFIIYGNSGRNEFIWDDYGLVRDNILIRNWTNIPAIFSKCSAISQTGLQAVLYRPMQIFTYMIDYSLWGIKVNGYHLTNVLLHIIASLCIYWFINILFNNKSLSVLTSVLFVLHPVHTEVVSYISGRADSLSLIFTLLCFIFYIQKRALFPLFFAFALLSKENALILPFLILLYHYTFKKKIKIGRLSAVLNFVEGRFSIILCISSIYIILRLTVFKSLIPHEINPGTVIQRIPGLFIAIASYIKILLFPFNLHMEYGRRLFYFSNPKAITGIFIVSALLLYCCKKRKESNLIFFSILWFFIALMPHANIYPVNAYMAEHWLYLPSVGFFLILANLLCHIYKSIKPIAILSIITIIIFYSHLTIKQNNYWKDPITFYARTFKYTPDSYRVCSNLSDTYLCAEKYEEAVVVLTKSLEIDPSSERLYNNLGVAYCYMGKYEEAIVMYKKALELVPDYHIAHHNLVMTKKSCKK